MVTVTNGHINNNCFMQQYFPLVCWLRVKSWGSSNRVCVPIQMGGVEPGVFSCVGENDISIIVEPWLDELPSPSPVGQMEYMRWKKHWSMSAAKPTDLQNELKQCQKDIFPNIHMLLRIACTQPITSVECERANSTLKLVKTHMRSTTTSSRMSDLCLMKVHRNKVIDYNKIVCSFAKKHPRRLKLSSVFEKQD